MKTKVFYHLFIIAVLVILTYANSVPNGFALDDWWLLINNPAVHGLNPGNLKTIFTKVTNTIEYLPVKDLTYMLDYSIWGLNPAGYHLLNVIYYLFLCIAFYLFLLRLLERWEGDRHAGLALFAALLFVVHPVHVEAVAAITHRKDLVSGLFFFLSLYMYLRFREKPAMSPYLLSVALFFIALFSKQTSVVLPGIIALLEFFHLSDEKAKFSKKTLRVVPFIALSVAASFFHYSVQKKLGVLAETLYGLPYAGMEIRIYTALRAVFEYIRILIFPYPLKVYYFFEISKSLFEPKVLLSAAGIGVLLLLAYRLRSRRPAVSFSIMWYLVCIIPVIGLIPVLTVIAERYLFIPSAGFCLLIAWVFIKGLPRLMPKMLSISAACLIIIGSSAYSMDRNRDWKDFITLLKADIAKPPYSRQLEELLLKEYIISGNFSEAFKLADGARKMRPDDMAAMVNYDILTAVYLYSTRNYTVALEFLDRIPKSGEIADVYYIRGLVFEAMGEAAKAKDSYMKALKAKTSLLIDIRNFRASFEKNNR